MNKLFVLSFEVNTVRTGYRDYFLEKVERRDHNVMIDGRNFFDQPIRKNIKTYEILEKL